MSLACYQYETFRERHTQNPTSRNRTAVPSNTLMLFTFTARDACSGSQELNDTFGMQTTEDRYKYAAKNQSYPNRTTQQKGMTDPPKDGLVQD